MRFLMLQSVVHATLAGVLLAFAVPSAPKRGVSPSHGLEHALHLPVAFFILPLFELANAVIVVDAGSGQSLLSMNSLGISLGLLVGKPFGVGVLCYNATRLGLCSLPPELRWYHGIGYTMSIFITNLAFAEDPSIVNSSIAILFASVTAGTLGVLWQRRAAIIISPVRRSRFRAAPNTKFREKR